MCLQLENKMNKECKISYHRFDLHFDILNCYAAIAVLSSRSLHPGSWKYVETVRVVSNRRLVFDGDRHATPAFLRLL
jgi:hypothetical protein